MNLSQIKSTPLRMTLRCLLIFVGAAMYATGFHFFLYPNQIVTGGISGVAQIINFLFDLPVGTVALVLNIPIFIAAWRGVNLRFLLMSLLGTACAYVTIDLFELIRVDFRPEPLLSCIYGGVLCGAGIGLLFRLGSNTGGTDILIHLVRRKLHGAQLGKINMCFQVVVVLAASVVFKNYYTMMYAIITIFLESQVIDAVLYGMDYGKSVIIISDHHEELASAITERLGRGVTLLYGRGGYTGAEKTVLLCAIRRNQINALRGIARRVDPDAFIIIAEAREVLGNGFDLNE